MSSQKISAIKGFTLIELLVVISIIAFLATILSVGLNQSRTKSLDARRANDVFAIQKGLNLYFTDTRLYPPGDNLVLGAPGSSVCLSTSGFAGSCPGGQIIYMAVVPGNPGPGGADYIYTQIGGGTDYTITFTLEQETGSLTTGPHTLSSSGIQ